MKIQEARVGKAAEGAMGGEKVVWRFHLRICKGEVIWGLTIAERNKQKRQDQMTLPFPSSNYLLIHLCQPSPRSKWALSNARYPRRL